MVRQTASLIFLEILGGLILLVLVAAGLLAARLYSGPMDLSMFKDDLENAMTEARDGREVRLGGVQLEWSAQDKRLHISGSRLQMMDTKGNLSAEADHANIVLSGSSLVLGKIEVLRLDLEGGWVNIDQESPTIWFIGGEPLPEIPAGKLPETPQEWLQRANQVLPPILEALKEGEQNYALEYLGFTGFEFRLRDSNQQPVLDVTDSTGRISREEDGILVSAAGTGAGAGLPGGLAATVRSYSQEDRLHAEFAVADWPLADLAARFGAEVDAFEGLPASADVTLDFARATGISEIAFHSNMGEGRVPFAGGLDVEGLDVTATYLANDDTMRIDLTGEKVGPASGQASMTLKNVLQGQMAHEFELKSENLILDLTPVFQAPIELTALDASGLLAVSARQIEGLDLKFRQEEAEFHLTGSLGLTADKQVGEPPILGSLSLETSGNITKETVMAFWPVGLGTGGRNFARDHVEAGALKDIKGHIDLKRDSFGEDGYLRDSDLELTFMAEDAWVKFLSDLPPVEKGRGTGRLTGNSFRVTLDSGEYGGWDLDEGAFILPAFNDRGGDFRVFARGRGPVSSIVQMLVDSRLEIDFDASRLSGDGEMTFEMFRPALDDVPYEDIRFTAIGTAENAGLKDAALGFDLTEGSTKVNVDQKGMMITGFGNLGPSPVQFTWRDDFSDDGQPSLLSATSIVTPDFLNEFGVLGRAYLSGEIPIEVQAEIGEGSKITADTALDLSESRLDLSEIGWVKARDKPAKASVHYEGLEDGYTATVVFHADDAYLDGDFTLGGDSKLISATLRRAYLKNKADVGGKITRKDGALNLSLTGTYLDLSGAMPGVGAIGDADTGSKTPLRVMANVDTLTLRPGLDMTEAKFSMVSGAVGLETFEATGLAANGSSFNARFDTNGGEAATFHVASGDAGFIASAFLGIDYLEGGNLEMDGTLANDNKPSKFDIAITDTRLRNAPFLTQILSLASLRGLADTLGGEGVLFSRLDIPLTVAGERYVVNGAKAQGPALGLTTNGYFDSQSGKIEFDGVLVPSFGMNSALGTIPIIGDLVVGRDGEGVFSLTYAIRGTMEKANVSVNPLSALAPGVIRRIFENPSDTRIPEAKARPSDEPIPSELPPIPDEEF
ncbi:MAG: AsmA-like C-terminal domain-containing protein [Rhodobacterales bacterium]|nr:AsmA-like C-terminal domain-containing protein [Rhodobacterales bacterium]